MTLLSVNVNKVALLRNSRHGVEPSPLRAGRICLEAGAAGLTVHPRPDQRHIRPGDVDDLAALVNEFPDAEFNIEGNPFQGDWMAICEKTRPHQCTLVPDDPNQFTSDHGFQFTDDAAGEAQLAQVSSIVEQCHAFGARVSVFMDPDPAMITRAAQTGCERVELYTESYAVAHAQGGDALEQSWREFADAAEAAQAAGLGVNAGHDLNQHNLPRFVEIPGILEVSIGHALIADALELGLAETVKRYLKAIA